MQLRYFDQPLRVVRDRWEILVLIGGGDSKSTKEADPEKSACHLIDETRYPRICPFFDTVVLFLDSKLNIVHTHAGEKPSETHILNYSN